MIAITITIAIAIAMCDALLNASVFSASCTIRGMASYDHDHDRPIDVSPITINASCLFPYPVSQRLPQQQLAGTSARQVSKEQVGVLACESHTGQFCSHGKDS